jgi:hypothetical protein
VDLTYTEPVPSVLNNKGEVRLAQLIINSSEPPGSITEEMFVAFVSTSVVGINFEYEKNDFTM